MTEIPRPQQTNLSISTRARKRLAEIAIQQRATKTKTAENAIDALWRSMCEIDFNSACTEMGVTGRREAFHAYWTIVRGARDELHTIHVWEIIYRCFETDGDDRDLHETQARALGSFV